MCISSYRLLSQNCFQDSLVEGCQSNSIVDSLTSVYFIFQSPLFFAFLSSTTSVFLFLISLSINMHTTVWTKGASAQRPNFTSFAEISCHSFQFLLKFLFLKLSAIPLTPLPSPSTFVSLWPTNNKSFVFNACFTCTPDSICLFNLSTWHR